ncbi:MAG: pyruvate dehydrogenase complex dihydrolipoamide acetyltransferase [Bradyrhizobium sp.]
MPIHILMPALSPSMESGSIVRWIKNEGDTIQLGEPLVEIESDKAIVEVEAMDEGILESILVPGGSSDVPVNQIIAVLRPLNARPGVDESPQAAQPAPSRAGSASARGAAPPVVPSADESPAAPLKPGVQQSSLDAERRIFASPLARRLARDGGIELLGIQGSGPGGRIIRKDIDALAPTSEAHRPGDGVPIRAVTEPSEHDVAAQFAQGTYHRIPLDAMRRSIAARLTLSKQSIPHFYMSIECEMDALMALRQQANQAAPRGADGKPAYRLSINDFVIKAHALALQLHPRVNMVWAHSCLLQLTHADIAVAVSVENGLLTPVIRRAEAKPLSAISAEMKDLAARAKARSLMPEDYIGGATTVSNLGMLGITEFHAIVNPPQSSILAVGAVLPRVVAKDGKIDVIQSMAVTLSCDHRVVDGALGAAFMSDFKRFIENPTAMLV